MGWNSTVIVLNDALGEIENDAQFGRKVAEAIKRLSVQKGAVNIPSGNHGNAAAVIETHHADSNAVVVVGGNFATVLGEVYAGMSMSKRMHHTPEGQLEILKELADQLGYNLSKKPGKKKRGDD